MSEQSGTTMETELSDVTEQKNIARNVILVLSGKGGVGKSTIACQLALELNRRGKMVGLLDADICGPSTARILKNCGRDQNAASSTERVSIMQSDRGWLPIKIRDGLCLMSIAYLLQDDDQAVIWRGPRKNAMIGQFLNDVYWPEGLDYLIVDTPPGTSDEHLSLCENLRIRHHGTVNALLVTTPQLVSVADVRREATFCRKMNLTLLGIVENMRGFVCPNCTECTLIFGAEGGAALAAECKTQLLGSVTLRADVTAAIDRGEYIIHPDLPAVVDRVVAAIESKPPSAAGSDTS